MWRFSDDKGIPKHKVSIDGRTNVTPHEIFEKFSAAYYGKTSWREYLEAYEPETILWRVESSLTSILLERNEWCHVYGDLSADSGHVVFIRQDKWKEGFQSLPSVNCSEKVAEVSTS